MSSELEETMTAEEVLRESFRKDILSDAGPVNPIDYKEDLGRLEFYLRHMEEFILSSEENEIENLSIGLENLGDVQKADFWMWNFPVHWQDIFGTRIRVGFCLHLCSHVETLLADIAYRIQQIERQEFGLKDLRGMSLRRKAREYFKRVGGFDGAPQSAWSQIDYVFQLRNAFVHSQGDLHGKLNDREFEKFLKSVNGIRFEHGFAELKAGSCDQLLGIVGEFQAAVLAEYEVYRKRKLIEDRGR